MGPLDDPVHSVTVYTIWPRFKSGTFVDNDSYSDLVASQAPEWYIRATFKGDMDLPLSSATTRLVYENTNPVKCPQMQAVMVARRIQLMLMLKNRMMKTMSLRMLVPLWRSKNRHEESCATVSWT